MLINFLRTKIKGVGWRIDLKRINEMNELITFSEEHFSNLYVREIFDEGPGCGPRSGLGKQEQKTLSQKTFFPFI